MNERIKEIAMSVQCERHWSEKDIEKFAQLIISECVDMFPDNLNSMRDYTGKACRYMIKEHFGVE